MWLTLSKPSQVSLDLESIASYHAALSGSTILPYFFWHSKTVVQGNYKLIHLEPGKLHERKQIIK